MQKADYYALEAARHCIVHFGSYSIVHSTDICPAASHIANITHIVQTGSFKTLDRCPLAQNGPI